MPDAPTHDDRSSARAGPPAVPLDALIVGGGVAGLWTLDACARAGFSAALVERRGVGAEQTGWSQGILHAGVKYALSGAMNESAASVSAMPERWHACLRGESSPDLSGVAVLSRTCWLWRTGSVGSRLGMLGARLALRTRPESAGESERPAALRGCPGEVARLGEWVIDPRGLAECLAAPHLDRIVRGEVSMRADGSVARVVDAMGGVVALAPRAIVLAAGGGNAALRESLGLDAAAQQVRPLRMVVLRGMLPELHGHCVDGSATRITVTSVGGRAAGERVWQVGGQVAERGPSMPREDHLRWSAREIASALPGVELRGCQIGSYDAPRAEGGAGGRRPDGVVVRREGRVVTIWPTKLVLAPRAADEAMAHLRSMLGGPSGDGDAAVRAALSGCDRARPAPAVWEGESFRWRAVAELIEAAG